MRAQAIILAGGLLALPGVLAAQVQSSAIGPGARVRIWAPEHGWNRRKAVVADIAGDTLVLSTETTEMQRGRSVRVETKTSLPITGIQRIEVSTGRHANVLGGLKNGVLIGGGIGLVLGVAAYASSNSDDWLTYGPEAIPLGALGGALYGAIIGTAIGALSKTEDWQQVWLQPISAPVAAAPRVRLQPHPCGLAIGIAIGF